jgi:hypothetical protein
MLAQQAGPRDSIKALQPQTPTLILEEHMLTQKAGPRDSIKAFQPQTPTLALEE